MNNNKSNCGTGYEVVLHVARMSVFRAGVREAFDHIIDVSVHVIERSLLMASHQQRSCALDSGGKGLLSQGSAVRLATENSFHYLGEAAVPHALDKVLHCSTARLRESQCECDLGLLHRWQTQVFFSICPSLYVSNHHCPHAGSAGFVERAFVRADVYYNAPCVRWFARYRGS